MSAEERTLEGLVHDMLWDRTIAVRLRRRMAANLFGGLAPVVAVIAHHDQENPGAPLRGQGRVLSVLEHTMTLAGQVNAHPERYTDAAAGLHAAATGGIDPALLRHAGRVLTRLPALATYREPAAQDAP